MKQSIIQTVGNTPLVKLNKINPFKEKGIEIYVKLEFLNPSGSIKDRIVKHIIEDAIATKKLKKGGVIIENTSGNTGASVAMNAAFRGYKAILTMPDKSSIEKQNALKTFGAEVIVCPTSAPPDSSEHYVNRAKNLAKNTPNSFILNQYDNKKNPEAHFLSTGPEIWKQTNGEVTHFVAAGSTGGTISGVGKYLKSKNKSIVTVMGDPVGSIYYEYFNTGLVPEPKEIKYQVEGVGEDHLAKAMDFSFVDKMYQFTDQEAFGIARRLVKEEGILGGGTGGANVWAALKLASTLENPATIVTVIPDSGIKYMSKIYSDQWMLDNGYTL